MNIVQVKWFAYKMIGKLNEILNYQSQVHFIFKGDMYDTETFVFQKKIYVCCIKP